MRRNFFQNLSSNIIQLVVNQLFGFLIFYLLSKYLSKAEFGELNWTLALFITCFSILSFGLDQLMVRKIAAGQTTVATPHLYFFHVLFSGLCFYSLLLVTAIFLPQFFKQHSLLLILGIGKLLFFFSTPFKQMAVGFERFNALLYMSVAASVLKGLLLVYLAFSGTLNLSNTVLVFIIADGSEACISFLIYKFHLKASIYISFQVKPYFLLIKESLPQAGVAFFSAAIARMDWIMIGVFLSASKLAEYGFAYKIFELSTLPLLMIAPLLVPTFSRQLKGGTNSQQHQKRMLLLYAELLIAVLSALLLNFFWIPVIDPLTAGRYGSVNAVTIFILSLSIPLLYLNNFLWTLHFAQQNLKMILRIFAFTFLVNLSFNCLLIPYFGNEGAAVTFVFSILFQTVLYTVKANIKLATVWQLITGYCAAIFLCSSVPKTMFSSVVQNISTVFGLLILIFLIAWQVRQKDNRNLRRILLWQRGNP